MYKYAGAPRSANTGGIIRSSALPIAVAISIALSAGLPAQTPKPSHAPGTTPDVHHLLGLDEIKRNAKGTLTIQNGAMEFAAGKKDVKVPAASI